MKTLECSSAGDKRFSALYAMVTFDGKRQSIEKHYQNCKRTEDNFLPGKGTRVHHIVIMNKQLPPTMLTPFYRYLWWLYFKENPELAKYARQFDNFNDKFRGRAVNCQADCVKAIASGNIDFFKEAHTTLNNQLKQN